MYSLGLSATDTTAFIAGLLGNHSVRITVRILNMDEDVLFETVPDGGDGLELIDGQVDVNGQGDPATRSMSMDLFDPGRKLMLDSNAPNSGAIYLDRMIQIRYGVRSYEHLNRWVDIPIFTGPITGLSRNNAVVSLTGSGKEVLAKSALFRTRNYAKGRTRSSIVKALMGEIGEKHFRFAELNEKTTKAYSLGPETVLWDLVRTLAHGWMLYYDGAGYLNLRPWLSRKVFTFSSGDGGSLLSVPQIDYNTDETYNAIRVKGATLKGAKGPLIRTVYPPKAHPLSAWSMARNGMPIIRGKVVEDTNLKTIADCQARGELELNKALMAAVGASFDSMPVPFLEHSDVIGIASEAVNMSFAIDQFTIPLKAGASQSNGDNSRRSVTKKGKRK